MLNRVELIGNLGSDPDVRYMPNGNPVANISVATTHRYKDKQTGEKKEITEWHRVIFFNKLAEVAGDYLKKGSQVYVEGRLQTRKWQAQDGSDRYSTEIIATDMKMLGRKSDGDSGAARAEQKYRSYQGDPTARDQPPIPNAPPPTNYDDFDDIQF